MGWIGDQLRPRFLDWAMRAMNELRPPTLMRAEGAVLEVGFGTGLNLRYYPASVKSLAALDPLQTGAIADRVQQRIAAVSFPVRRFGLPADGELPFEDKSFDCAVSTWTLCSIPDPARALAEMHRVLGLGGRYLFIEHGRSESPRTALWQDRLNPIWRRCADGCNMNRTIDRLVADAGFELVELERFRAEGPALLSSMYRGVATRVA